MPRYAAAACTLRGAIARNAIRREAALRSIRDLKPRTRTFSLAQKFDLSPWRVSPPLLPLITHVHRAHRIAFATTARRAGDRHIASLTHPDSTWPPDIQAISPRRVSPASAHHLHTPAGRKESGRHGDPHLPGRSALPERCTAPFSSPKRTPAQLTVAHRRRHPPHLALRHRPRR